MATCLKSDQVVIIGGGGHASVIFQLLCNQNIKVLGVVSPHGVHENLKDLVRFDSDIDFIKLYPPGTIQLVNGVGSVAGSMFGCDVYEQYKKLGYSFLSVISKHAVVDCTAAVGAGAVVMNGAVVQAGAVIGENTVVNTGAVVDHDCDIGPNNQIGPGAVLCGGVITGDRVAVGAGACIAQTISIGDHAIIGAGSVVVRNLPKRYRILPAPHRIEST